MHITQKVVSIEKFIIAKNFFIGIPLKSQLPYKNFKAQAFTF